MKRRITTLLTIALSALLLGGCGGSSKSLTFSELFEKDVIVYCASIGEGETFAGKDEGVLEVYLLKSDGTFSHYDTFGKGIKLGEYAQLTDEEVIANSTGYCDFSGNYKLGVETDETGNTVIAGNILQERTSGKKISNPPFYTLLRLGAYSGRMNVYESSYIVFQRPGDYGSTYFCLIRDTSDTKEKEIVFDKVGTEGICVDMSPKEAFK